MLQSYKFIRIQYIVFLSHFLILCITVVINCRFPRLSRFCSNNHNSVSTSCPINSSRRRILQDINRFNIIRRYIRNPIHRKAVHNIQRAIILCNRTSTTNSHLNFRIGSSICRRHINSRHTSGKSSNSIRNWNIRDGLSRQSSHRPRQIFSRNSSVANYHDLIHINRLLLHHNLINKIFTIKRNLHSLHAEIRKDQYFSSFRNLQIKSTIGISQCSGSCSFHRHCCTNNRFSIRINDTSGNISLCKSHNWAT